MSNIAPQTVRIKSHITGNLLYLCKTSRDIDEYPRTLEGRTALANAIKNGTYPHQLTVDNGAIIDTNTVPPLVKPDAPATTYPAFSVHLQAEGATGAGTWSGSPGDGVTRGAISDTSGNLTYTVNNTLGANLSGFKLTHRYQTNLEVTGVGAYRINGGDWVNFNMTGNTGTQKTQILATNIALISGNNTIDFKWVSGTVWFQDWIEVVRDATS
ncbi:hypothetical protein GO755_30360 [Spirosoma sp. HMF4905]|uniref:CBM6 domain-containing protein n=1 Tax=Spirosoma arboris TaxID=2682092 RepID=A0A7K1SKT7_9BACT|nr:hypothetical protein [Spirosoma arboris]MVM34374.1 hypothetical protein [Spirosoma arboris]